MIKVTYMLAGAAEHEDFVGHRGVINPGDLQWMTAGRGIVHCEMPYGDEVSVIILSNVLKDFTKYILFSYETKVSSFS